MTATRVVKVGTRRSALAQAQTGLVIRALGTATEIVPIVTEGDRDKAPLAQIGGTGVFVSALRQALLAGEIDVAVHSYKDLPTAPADGVQLAAVPTRDDPRDALVARAGLTLGELPAGSRVGTGSPRRAAQLRALGLGLEIVDIRGNVDTRLRAVEDGRYDAVVLAYAGLRRLGRADVATEVLDPIQILPAPAQGALAVECRADDADTNELLQRLDDADTRAAVAAERAVLVALEAGCSAPIGALAEIAVDDDGDNELYLRASVTAVDGGAAVRQSGTGSLSDADGVGRRLALELLADGAAQMMATAAGDGPMRNPELGSSA